MAVQLFILFVAELTRCVQ